MTFQLSETGEGREAEAWGEVDQWAESYSQVGGVGSGILLSNDMTAVGDDTYFSKITDFKYSDHKQSVFGAMSLLVLILCAVSLCTGEHQSVPHKYV